MKKIYHIEYLHIGGERHLQTESIYSFCFMLDEAINDPFITTSSIKIYTEEIPS